MPKLRAALATGHTGHVSRDSQPDGGPKFSGGF